MTRPSSDAWIDCERSAPSEVLCLGDYFQESGDPEDDSGGAGLDSADPQEEDPAEEDDTEEESGTEDEPLVKEEPRCSCAAGAGPVGAGWGVLSLIWLLRRRGARHE